MEEDATRHNDYDTQQYTTLRRNTPQSAKIYQILSPCPTLHQYSLQYATIHPNTHQNTTLKYSAMPKNATIHNNMPQKLFTIQQNTFPYTNLYPKSLQNATIKKHATRCRRQQ